MSEAATRVSVGRLGEWSVVYETCGEGVPAVLVHGWGSDRRIWREQLDAGWPGVRLIAVDLLGHGDSDAPPVTYSMKVLAESVRAVLDDLGLARAALVGHSMGVGVVRQMYRLDRERVSALALLDGYLRPAPMNPWQVQLFERMRGPAYGEVIEQMIATMPFQDITADGGRRVVDAMRRTPQHVMVSTLEATNDPASWPPPSDTIDVPTLVLRARNPFAPLDPAAVRAEALAIAPGAEVHVWGDVSHALMLERPRELGALLTDFVKRASREPIR